MKKEQAENIALQALGWLAADEEMMGNFLNASGLDPSDIRKLVSDPAFMGSVLDHILEADASVLALASALNIAPETVQAARSAFPGGAQIHWT